MKARVYCLNSFAKTKEGGNPAGIVLEADNFSSAEMQKIAKKVGFSETAFIQKSEQADFKVSFFTPNAEVDLCGHATIAAFYLLKDLGIIKAGRYTQETGAGILGIEVAKSGKIFMNQNLPKFCKSIDTMNIANSLNLTLNDFIADLPVQIVSTGLRDIFIPIKSLETLLAIQPNLEEIAKLSKAYNVTGYHVFTLETKLGSTAHCRNFAPLYEIPEESATGTSNGALGCYLFEHGVVSQKQANNLVFEQGYSMGKPSEILVKLIIDQAIKEVQVGGTALITEELDLSL